MARLEFDMEQVAGVVQHARGGIGFKMTMDERAEVYGEDRCGTPQPGEERRAQPQLWLVKDHGIYLMSPAVYREGEDPFPREKAERIAAFREAGMDAQAEELERSRNVCPLAYAEGYDPTKVAPEELWDRTHAVSGDDFGTYVPLDWYETAVRARSPKFVVSYEVRPDGTQHVGLLLPVGSACP